MVLDVYAGMQVSILINGGMKSEAKWVTTHLAHYPWEWGERPLWRLIVLWPLLFQQRPTVECFYPRWGCGAGQLLLRWTMAVLITEGLRGQRPKPTRADSLQPLLSTFSFAVADSRDICSQGLLYYTVRNKRLNKAWAIAKWFKDMTTVTRIFKGNHPGNVILFPTLHLGETFLSLPPSCQGHSYDPWNGFENNPLKKKKKKHELRWRRRYKYAGVCSLSFLNPHIHHKNNKMRKTCTSFSLKLFFYL